MGPDRYRQAATDLANGATAPLTSWGALRDAVAGTVNIDARGAQMGVAEQIDARLRAAIPEIARIAKESVTDGRRRGQVI
jgi:hypothetical protein